MQSSISFWPALWVSLTATFMVRIRSKKGISRKIWPEVGIAKEYLAITETSTIIKLNLWETKRSLGVILGRLSIVRPLKGEPSDACSPRTVWQSTQAIAAVVWWTQKQFILAANLNVMLPLESHVI